MSKLPIPAAGSNSSAPGQRRAQRLADEYLVAADAPATVRAYTADWQHFASWCQGRQIVAMSAIPELVGEYLAELGEGYAKATLRRKVAAIARTARIAGTPLDTRHPSIRDVLRGIGRTHGSPARRAQALTTDEVQGLVETCDDDLVGLRDRALLLLTFAGALRRSELCGIEVEHLQWKPRSLELLIPRSKTDPRERETGSAFLEAVSKQRAPFALSKPGCEPPVSTMVRCSAQSPATTPSASVR